MLSIQNLSKTYRGRQALRGLSLKIDGGEVYGLLGPNGAGKTTTINLICGLLEADSGQVLINGQPAGGPTKGWVGVMPQENLLYRTLSCAENLAFFAKVYGLWRRERSRRLQECLSAVNLLDRAHTPVENLSGGMQRRLSLAIAIVHRPKLLILDEPTTGLDIEARHEVWDLIRTLSRDQGMTILLTTHLLDEAERLCHRIGVIKQGQLLTEGTLAELRQGIPACEIMTVETADPQAAIARAIACGFTPRYYGRDLAFWLPEALELRELLDRFAGVPLDAISRSPVKLEHIYLEVTQAATALTD
ncbi:MAG TPA: ABC transporter ATP-binding protein [Candidatus Obscuribacterales bacterium]